MKLTLRFCIHCTSCFADRMVDINLYQPEGKVEWREFKCHMCGSDEFFALPYFEKDEKSGK